MPINAQLIKAHSLHEDGQLDDARLIYEGILLIEPSHFDALQLLGMLMAQLGFDQEALQLLLKAVEVNQGNAIVFNNLALLLSKQRDYLSAIHYFSKAIEVNPSYAEAYYNRAIALQISGDFEIAKSSYLSCIAINPEFFSAHINLGFISEFRKDYDSALIHYKNALNIKQNYAPLYFNLGNVFKELNQFKDAIENYDLACHFQKNYKEALFNKACVFELEGEFENALTTYDEVLELDSKYIECYINKSIIFCKLRRFDQAQIAIEGALPFQRDHPAVLNQLGIVLRCLKMHSLALEKISEALSIDPQFALGYVNQGNVLTELNKFSLALESYNRALELEPGMAKAQWNRALLLLQMKFFDQGWSEYKYRWSGADFKTTQLKTNRPYWQPGDRDKRLLIWSEQGIGTEFMFVNFLTKAHLMSHQIEVHVESRSLDIYRRSFPSLKFSSNEVLLDETTFDCHLPIGSLPQYLFVNEKEFRSNNRPYLKVNQLLCDQLRSQYKRTRPLVGISWATRSQTTGLDRSINLMEFIDSIKYLDLDFISLQYGDVKDEIIEVNTKFGINIQTADSIDNYSNIDGLLSLIQACDLVLSIDNSTVHFAGAIGKKTWVMLPFNADWRWFNDWDQCMWYPSTKLFRQSNLGHWDSVFERLRRELATL